MYSNRQRVAPKFQALLILILSTGLLLAASVQARTVTVDYSFERPQVRSIMLDGKTFDRVHLPGIPNGGPINHPSLPVAGAQILLPMGAEVESIKIIASEKITIGSGYDIEPVLQSIPLSLDPSELPRPVQDQAIYSLQSQYPGVDYEEITTQEFRGYKILHVKLHPVQYVPATGELYAYSQLTVIVNCTENGTISELYRGFAGDASAVSSKVDNLETIASYASAPVRFDRSYQLLIITSSDFVAAFQPLKDYHDTTGMPTEIHTLDAIGTSTPDGIRNYIFERYVADGIDYVIIGRDDDLIPAKDLYVEAWEGSSYTEYSMPGDMYFGCLNGDYNADGDSYVGEPSDNVDLTAEVWVGRVHADNVTEVERFVSKTIQYLTAADPFLFDIQLVGEHLGFGGEGEYGAWSLEELIGGTSNHGYITVGFPTEFNFDELYDRDYPGNDWPRSEIVARINAGRHAVNHYGHCSYGWALKMSTSSISELTNTDHCFIYSQGCMAGGFDGTDCFAEGITIKTDAGAFAAVMNARYGWGNGSTDGPSHRFNREFWDAVFDTESENKPQIGRANHDSKEDLIYRIDESCMRWCTYELNLFGDPTVAFKMIASCEDWGLEDSDGDEICDPFDNCPNNSNQNQEDLDGDGIGDVCDACPADPDNDIDNDGLCADVDNCPLDYNPAQTDSDGDGVGDPCDACEGFDDNADADADGWADSCDNCPAVANSDQSDHDSDGVGTECDNCILTPNSDQADEDEDGHGDVCDICPGYDDFADDDGDSFPNDCDNCPEDYNWLQEDSDVDTHGDVCDNCPEVYNIDQLDTDEDGTGDVCDVYCGDVNGDINGPNVADLTYLVAYLFNGGPPPPDPNMADMNGHAGTVNIIDLTYLVAYLFGGGPEPVCPPWAK